MKNAGPLSIVKFEFQGDNERERRVAVEAVGKGYNELTYQKSLSQMISINAYLSTKCSKADYNLQNLQR